LRRRRGFLWLALSVSGFACARASVPAPVAPADDAARLALERRAAEACCRQRPPCDLPPHPFTTDVCSLWPDGDWGGCCIEHDIAYWCGGPDEARAAADRTFRDCLAEHGDVLAGLSWFGVRLGGVAWLPFPWRWGYGWDWLDAP
jgi:hypothetical protein